MWSLSALRRLASGADIFLDNFFYNAGTTAGASVSGSDGERQRATKSESERQTATERE